MFKIVIYDKLILNLYFIFYCNFYEVILFTSNKIVSLNIYKK